jgi:hypothetical protein
MLLGVVVFSQFGCPEGWFYATISLVCMHKPQVLVAAPGLVVYIGPAVGVRIVDSAKESERES